MPQGKIGDLKPPADRDEISVLASEVRWPNVDGATLHRVLVTVPKQLDCDIAQNPNVFQQDLLSIWNEHACPDSYFAANPQTPLDVVKVIFDSHDDAEADEKTRIVRKQAAVRLAQGKLRPRVALLAIQFERRLGHRYQGRIGYACSDGLERLRARHSPQANAKAS